ncbi:hypothetical protein TNCV_4283601 [Trichonephila clavipes]|nr:hypothetical protein TNCV_4283601 [Trichonephila clavipes]
MSRREPQSDFDQVPEFNRGRIVAYRDIVDYLSGKSVVVLDVIKQLNCGGGDRGRVAIYRPFGEFRRAKSHCHLYGAEGQRQAYLLPMPR